MKLFGAYLKGRLKIIILLALITVVQGVVFFLYSVSLEPVIYSLQLLAFIYVIAFAVDFFQFYNRHKNLKHSLEAEQVYQIELSEPQDIVEQDYQELLTKLISEKYEINEQRVQSMTDLRDYYATWAHQIKTPISAMDMILQTQNEGETLDVSELKRQLFKIDFYVDAVMNYLRLEDMSSDYNFDEYDVENVVRKAVKKFASQFIGKKITVELTELNVKVKTDEKWLGFMIEQLLSNAVKYTQNGGKISIYMKETFNANDRILVIEDNGIGIEEEDLPRIFERGYTGYNGRMSKKSSGIGLYLCRKAADKLGIGLKIESQAGKGTLVYIDMTQKYTEHE